jgi:hypothetical protein
MFPFEVDPKWYENYWYSERPRPKRRTAARSLARLGVLVVLLAGSGVVLSHYHVHGPADGYQDWEQE